MSVRLDLIFQVSTQGTVLTQLEEIMEKNTKILMFCIDLEKVNNKVARELLWRVVKAHGVNSKLMRTVRHVSVLKSMQNLDYFCVGKERDRIALPMVV